MKLHPRAGELSLMDEAVIRYHAKGLDFLLLLDMHLNYRYPDERYIYSGPDHFILAEVIEDDEGKFWCVNYAASRTKNAIQLLMELAPFKLDRVAFCRYRNISNDSIDKYKFYKWDKLYGKKTTTTTSTTSATASSATATCTDASTKGTSQASDNGK